MLYLLKKNFFILVLFSIVSMNLKAEDKFAWSFRMNGGVLNGEANELVYQSSGSYKLSELIWGLEDVKMIGAGLSLETPYNMKLNFDFYMDYDGGESTIEDYDWTDPSISEWTKWSKSPTDIREVHKYDLNIEFFLFPIKWGKAFFIAGYKQDSYKWKAYGGNYIYSDSGFRKDLGDFGDKLVLSYQQEFKAFYIGIGSRREKKRFSAEGRVIYSNAVEAEDKDIHHKRELLFQDYFEKGEFIGAELKGRYRFWRNFSITAAYNFEKYFLNKGWTKATCLPTGGVDYYTDDSSGIESETSMYSIGIEYRK